MIRDPLGVVFSTTIDSMNLLFVGLTEDIDILHWR
jgi:hypothetical protein